MDLQEQVFLVIDNQSNTRLSIKNILFTMGVKNSIFASSYDEGIKIVSQQSIHVIICNWNLVGKDGFQLLTDLKSDPRYSSISFILMTANRARKDIVAAIKLGVNELVIKPFSAAMLKEKISRILKNPNQRIIDRIPEPESSEAELDQEQSSDEKSKILIVDDVAENIDVFSGILRDHYRIKATINGEKALKLVQANPDIDLILLDIMMPIMDGMTVCQQLKSDPKTAHIPVIFVSAKNEVIDITRGFSLGAVDYISKPVIPAILLARVHTHINLKRALDQARNEVDILVENARLQQDMELMLQHEIKRPLVAIQAWSERLLSGGEPTLAEVKRQAQQISEAAKRSLLTLSRAQTVSQLEQGGYTLQLNSVDLLQELRNSMQRLQGRAKSAIQFKSDRPQVVVKSDGELLPILFDNLLYSAANCLSKQGELGLSVGLEAGQWQIRLDLPLLLSESEMNTLLSKYTARHEEVGESRCHLYTTSLIAQTLGGSIHWHTVEGIRTRLMVALPETLDP